MAEKASGSKPTSRRPSDQISQNLSKLDKAPSPGCSSERDSETFKCDTSKQIEMDNTSEDSSTGISCVASTSEGSESFPYSRRESSNKYADETENEVETSDISHSSSELAEPPYELIYRNTVDYSDFW